MEPQLHLLNKKPKVENQKSTQANNAIADNDLISRLCEKSVKVEKESQPHDSPTLRTLNYAPPHVARSFQSDDRACLDAADADRRSADSLAMGIARTCPLGDAGCVADFAKTCVRSVPGIAVCRGRPASARVSQQSP